jgi:hypothetical protein
MSETDQREINKLVLTKCHLAYLIEGYHYTDRYN